TSVPQTLKGKLGMNDRLISRLILTAVIFIAMLIARLALTSGVFERLILTTGKWLGWGMTGGFLTLPAERAARLAIALLLLFGLMVLIQWIGQQNSAAKRQPRGRQFVDSEQLRREQPARNY